MSLSIGSVYCDFLGRNWFVHILHENCVTLVHGRVMKTIRVSTLNLLYSEVL